MTNLFSSSENDNNSFDNNENKKLKELKKKERDLNYYLSPLTTISDLKQTNEPFDFLAEKDYEEILELSLYNTIKNSKNEEKIKEILKNKYIKKFIIKKSGNIFNIKKEIKLGRPKKILI